MMHNGVSRTTGPNTSTPPLEVRWSQRFALRSVHRSHPSQQMWCRAPRRRRARLGSDVDKSTLDIDTRSRRDTRRSGHGLLSTFLTGSDVRQIRNRHSEATPAANARRGHLIWVGSLSVDVERVIDSPMSEMRAELIDCHDCGRPVSFSAVSRYSSGRRLWTFW
jgi:hypothetical protein